jgi:aspartate ammonia-lyase
MKYRVEKDYLGEVKVPSEVYYGAQTARAVKNFPISGLRLQKRFIIAQAMVKKAAALANMHTKKLSKKTGKAIVRACDEIISGKLHDNFVVDVYQAGAGTSQNMNANEVISNRAIEILGSRKGNYKIVHPNDHVNMSQSTNDTIHTIIHVASLLALNDIYHSLENLEKELSMKSRKFDKILKSGRTHLQDAVPMTLGQEFSGYSAMIRQNKRRIKNASKSIEELPIGGTAIGTSLNAGRKYTTKVVKEINSITGMKFKNAENIFESMQNTDAILELSSALRSLAVSLTKIANDIRLLQSGPTTGLDEISLPAVQPGSSIMPGKVNPVMAEMINMVSYQVIGNDTTISNATQAGQLELNVMMPVIGYNIINSIEILARGIDVFTNRCIRGIEANQEKCLEYLEKNPIAVTALNPYIGYEKSAEVAKRAYKESKTIKQVVLEMGLLTEKELDKILDYRKMTKG